MTIYIGAKPYFGQGQQEATNLPDSYNQLGQPTISDQQTEQYNPETSVTLLEEEYVYCNRSVNPQTRFFATRELVTNLFIYIFNNAKESLAIHYSGWEPLNWELLINKFQQRQSLSAIFIGARIDREEVQNSCQAMVKGALYTLREFYARKRPTFNFTITHQKTLRLNHLKEEDLPGLITVYLANKFNEISQALFRKPFHFPINTKDPKSNFQGHPNLGTIDLAQLTQILFWKAESIVEIGLIKNEAYLFELGTCLFSSSCYNSLKQAYLEYSNTSLCDFAVNLENHRVFPISQPMSQIPQVTLRQAVLHNKWFVSDQSHHPTCVFDGRYFPSAYTFSKEFIARCRKHAANIQQTRDISSIPTHVNFPLIIDFKALPFITQKDTLMMKFACKFFEARLVLILERFIKNQKTLRIACAFGDSEQVKTLLQEGLIDPNEPDEHGNTPLHFAVMDAFQVSELLNKHNPEGDLRTCLQGHPAIVRLLLGQEGVNQSPRNTQGHLPLDLAKRDAMPENKKASQVEKDVANEIVAIFNGKNS